MPARTQRKGKPEAASARRDAPVGARLRRRPVRVDVRSIPSDRARWSTIERFALTFDGYTYWGGTQQCARIANARRQETLVEALTCLFFEQRRWRHFGEAPNRKEMRYIRSLVRRIRILAAPGKTPRRRR